MTTQVIHIAWYVFVVMISVMLAELARGYSAYKEGDATPKNSGRLTLNPFSHIDVIGSILFPLVLLLTSSGLVLGWARHIPYNEYNFKNKKRSIRIVALSGIFAHVCFAILSAVAVHILLANSINSGPVVTGFTSVSIVNFLLALFNLLPVPPLDGSKLFFSVLSDHFNHTKRVIEYYSVPILIIVILLLWQYVFEAVNSLFYLITGIHLGVV